MTSRYRHVVLDWDGTVVDSLSAKARNAAELLAPALGVKTDAVEESYRRNSGVARRTLFDRIAAELLGRGLSGDEFLRLSAAFTALNLERIPTEPWPDAAKTLPTLSGRGVLLAVSSAAPEDDLDPRVRRSGLWPLFDAVLSTRPGFAKGAEHIAFLCGRWAVQAPDVLVVGDEAADAALARAAGARSAIVLHSLRRIVAEQAHPDHVLERLDELCDLCAGPS